ncbi:hypothetical protein EMIT0P201_40241 [Pseudomonas chlororaphis]
MSDVKSSLTAGWNRCSGIPPLGVHPNLNASNPRHVSRFSKLCRDTCHTEIGGQAQPPLGVG